MYTDTAVMKGRSVMKKVFDIIEKAVAVKKASNQEQHHAEYIQYDPKINKGTNYEQNGYSTVEKSIEKTTLDKVLRIPFPYFMTVEECTQVQAAQGYHLKTYTPCRLSTLQKCGLFRSFTDDSAFHRHDYYEMVYVYSGKRIMQVENQEVVLSEHDLCIFDMQCAHLDVRTQSEGIVFYCGFTRKIVDEFFLKRLKNKHIQDFLRINNESSTDISFLRLNAEDEMLDAVNAYFSEIFGEMEHLAEGFERMAQIYTLRILNCCRTKEESDTVVFSKKLRGTKLFHAVAKYISSNIADISLEKLCGQFHFQEDYYNRLIKKNTGMTYSEYVRNLRLEKAKNLLLNTDKSVREIMEYLGYGHHAYFYKIFQEETGKTPQEFRNRNCLNTVPVREVRHSGGTIDETDKM